MGIHEILEELSDKLHNSMTTIADEDVVCIGDEVKEKLMIRFKAQLDIIKYIKERLPEEKQYTTDELSPLWCNVIQGGYKFSKFLNEYIRIFSQFQNSEELGKKVDLLSKWSDWNDGFCKQCQNLEIKGACDSDDADMVTNPIRWSFEELVKSCGAKDNDSERTFKLND